MRDWDNWGHIHERRRDHKFWTQYGALLATAPPDVCLDYAPRSAGDLYASPDIVFERNRLLVRVADVGLVLSYLPEARVVPERGGHGIAVIDTFQESVPQVCRRLDDIAERDPGSGLRVGIAAPNHLVSITQGDGVNLCPATEPGPLHWYHHRLPRRGPGSAGCGVRVLVIDTGLDAGFDDPAHGLVAAQGIHPTTYSSEDWIKEYAGHGTFVSGVVKRVAPAAGVTVSNALEWAGAVLEDDLGDILLTVLNDPEPPQIINLSAGCTTYKHRPPRGLEPVFDRLRAPDCQTLLVAAAGNDGSTEEFWPAAAHTLPDLGSAVISVGALRQDGKGRACFSNYGPLVQVFAPGERLVNNFPRGRYAYVDEAPGTCRYHDPALYKHCTCVTAPPQHKIVRFRHREARWSGTSFATPIVVGRVARHMSETGRMNPRSAAADLLGGNLPGLTDVDGVRLPLLPPPGHLSVKAATLSGAHAP
jgi:subtilisin family serine protease